MQGGQGVPAFDGVGPRHSLSSCLLPGLAREPGDAAADRVIAGIAFPPSIRPRGACRPRICARGLGNAAFQAARIVARKCATSSPSCAAW